jgi:hypothetical protein
MPIDNIQDFIRPKRTQSMPILQQGDLVSTADWIDANRCPRRATVNLVAKRTSTPILPAIVIPNPSPFVIPTEGRNLLFPETSPRLYP